MRKVDFIISAATLLTLATGCASPAGSPQPDAQPTPTPGDIWVDPSARNSWPIETPTAEHKPTPTMTPPEIGYNTHREPLPEDGALVERHGFTLVNLTGAAKNFYPYSLEHIDGLFGHCPQSIQLYDSRYQTPTGSGVPIDVATGDPNITFFGMCWGPADAEPEKIQNNGSAILFAVSGLGYSELNQTFPGIMSEANYSMLQLQAQELGVGPVFETELVTSLQDAMNALGTQQAP